MKFRAVSGKVIIKLDEEPKISKGGIHLPETAKNSEDQKAMQGVVVSFALPSQRFNGNQPGEVEFNAGDRVFFEQWEGDEIIDDDGTKYRVVGIKHVLAVLE